MIWSDYRTIIRRTLLKDTGVTPRISDAALLDSVGWALDAFCAHTAAASTITYTGDGTTTTFTLPANIYVPVDEAGLVYSNVDERTIDYGIPVFKTPGALIDDEQGFYCWNQDQLIFLIAPGVDVTVNVFHYAYYTHPISDSDTIGLPSWAQAAVAYLTAAHSLSGETFQESIQGDFKQRPDTGTPVQLPVRMQQMAWFSCYEAELKRHPVQDRRYLYQKRD